MTKWLSNLIIVLLCFIGIQMLSKGIEQKFYFDEVLPPSMNNMEKKEGANQEPHLAVQILTANEALYKERLKKGLETPQENQSEGEYAEAGAEGSATPKTNQVQADPKDDTMLVTLNAMDLTQLQTLKGIGPVIAERIIAYKKANGPFKTLESLSEVKGIGPKKLEGIISSLRQK